MKIEKVLPEDAEELLKIYAPYVESTAVSFECEAPSAEEFRNRIITISAKYPYIKAVDDDGRIMGYAYAGTFKPRAAYNWSVETTVYLRPDSRRSGIGSALYCELEKLLKKMNIKNMNACIAYTETEDEYLTQASVHFHRSMGFAEVAHFHKCSYKFDTWYDMIWMEKIIGKHNNGCEPVAFGEWDE